MLEPYHEIFESCMDMAYNDNTAVYYKRFIEMTNAVNIKNDDNFKEYLYPKIARIFHLRRYYNDPEMSQDKEVLDAVLIEHLWSFYVIYKTMSSNLIELYDTFNTRFRVEINKDDTIFDTDIHEDEITKPALLFWEANYNTKVIEIKALKRRI